MNRYTASSTLRRLLVAMAVVFGSSFAATTANAAATPATTLQSVDVQPIQGKGLQVTMTLSGPASAPLDFTIDNPARISFDLPNTGLALDQRRIDVHSGGLDSILAAEASGRSRVVLNLDRMVSYTTRVEGNRIVVVLGESGAAAAVATTPAGNRSAVASVPTASARSIQSLDFRRGNDGAGRVVVRLSDPRTPINTRQQGN
ncbi:MAG: hypothetical protein RL030_1461, partial [Pseudomonadota bacterium]